MYREVSRRSNSLKTSPEVELMETFLLNRCLLETRLKTSPEVELMETRRDVPY